jgi:acetyl-CoA acyltransferase
MKNVYIVAAQRSPLTKAKKGSFANFRPDELLAQVINKTVAKSGVKPEDVGDVVIGCAFPEAEQGLNIARVAALLAGMPDCVPGLTINRYCSSGLNSVAIAANSIATGQFDVAIAGGVESMSMIPMGGNDYSISPEVFTKDENVAISYGMGITAEKVAEQWKVSREEQDKFAVSSHKKANQAQIDGLFKDEILPIDITCSKLDITKNEVVITTKTITEDEGIRADTTVEGLAKLRPAFAAKGSVTAGNSSQMTDGAACIVLVSEEYLKKHNLKPIGRFISFAVAGVPAEIMGIGPIKAIPKALAQANLTLEQIDWIELNEAFAAQGLAVINDLGLDPSKVNPYGGAIALGHPLGATGAVLTAKLLHGLRRTGKKYGIVTMCIGTGMGAAGIFEAL